MAHQAFGAAKKNLEQIGGLLDARTDSLQARDIKDMSLAFNKILGCVSEFTPSGQQAAAVSNVQIVMPPKMDELSHAWARSARGHAPKIHCINLRYWYIRCILADHGVAVLTRQRRPAFLIPRTILLV